METLDSSLHGNDKIEGFSMIDKIEEFSMIDKIKELDSRFRGNDIGGGNDKIEEMDSSLHGNDIGGGNDKMEINLKFIFNILNHLLL